MGRSKFGVFTALQAREAGQYIRVFLRWAVNLGYSPRPERLYNAVMYGFFVGQKYIWRPERKVYKGREMRNFASRISLEA
jgi:hypothetical protein